MIQKVPAIAGTFILEISYIRKNLRKLTKKALPISRKCLFHEGGRWDLNPRSSGPQADADGFSAVFHVLIESCFASIFRGEKLNLLVLPLQKNS